MQPDAPAAVLKSSYRALMLTLEIHPDRGGEHWNAALVNEAYSVLSDPTRRAAYDRTLDMGPIQIGRAAGTAATSNAPDFETSSSHQQATAAMASCIFCGAESASGQPATNSICSNCKSPLSPAGDTTHDEPGRRAARRVTREGDIGYWVDWPQPVAFRGRIVDLSPLGLRFEATAPLQQFQIIKIDGEVLDAVARVAACTERDGVFSIGVEFYTVRFHQPRGTYLSARA